MPWSSNNCVFLYFQMRLINSYIQKGTWNIVYEGEKWLFSERYTRLCYVMHAWKMYLNLHSYYKIGNYRVHNIICSNPTFQDPKWRERPSNRHFCCILDNLDFRRSPRRTAKLRINIINGFIWDMCISSSSDNVLVCNMHIM